MVTIFESFANKKILLNFILEKFSLLYTISTLNMKKVTGIGGIFFKSKDPKAITAWYAHNLGLQTNPYGATFEWYEDAEGKKKADTQWAPFGDNTKYFEPSTKEFMINYRVENLEALRQRGEVRHHDPIAGIECEGLLPRIARLLERDPGRGDLLAHDEPAVELDAVALAVVEGDGFDTFVTRKRMGQAGGGVLPAREKDECGRVHGGMLKQPVAAIRRLLPVRWLRLGHHPAEAYSGLLGFLILLGE